MNRHGSGPVGHGQDWGGVDESAGGLRTPGNGPAHVWSTSASHQGLAPPRMAALTTLEWHRPLGLEDLATMMVNTTAGITGTLTDDERAALQTALPILTALGGPHPDHPFDPGGVDGIDGIGGIRPTGTPVVTRRPRPHGTTRGGPGA